MIIEQLFGSTTRWKLMWLFLQHPEQHYFVRELVRTTDSHIHAVRRELAHLEKLGFLKIAEGSSDIFESEAQQAKKKYYVLNPEFMMLDELKALFVKDGVLGQQNFVDKLENLGKVDYLLLSGNFTGDDTADIDMLLVGSIPKDKLDKTCQEYQKIFDREMRYSLMTHKEFQYRKDVVDRFLYGIFEHKHVVVTDKLKQD
ncbi:MAG: hypothetical protein CMI52_00430 [Parcubacteria group bacterium]|nr:hypothetical protein [Parcubacteria group bacterium]